MVDQVGDEEAFPWLVFPFVAATLKRIRRRDDIGGKWSGVS
jgi:hypothetical protein